MTSNHRNEFIRTVRAALGHPACIRRSTPELFPLKTAHHAAVSARARNRTRSERLDLLNRLREEAIPLNLNVMQVENDAHAADTIVNLARQTELEWGETRHIVTWKHPLVDRLHLSERQSEAGIPVHVAETGITNRNEFLRLAQRACIGVTAADFVVTESATLVLRTRPGQPRSVSLTPSVHVAVVTLNQLIDSFFELYAILQCHPTEVAEELTSCMTFISGPSKTADIEACMVHGAHGPREVHILVLTLPEAAG